MGQSKNPQEPSWEYSRTDDLDDADPEELMTEGTESIELFPILLPLFVGFSIEPAITSIVRPAMIGFTSNSALLDSGVDLSLMISSK